MAEITTKEVRDYLYPIQGKEITLDDLRKAFNILPGSKSYDSIRNILFQLAESKVVVPTGKKNGVYKVVAKVEPVPVFSVARERRPPFNLIFPRDFETMQELEFSADVVIREGDLVLISGLSNYGKGHPDGTPILTPIGWVNVEKICPGDIIFGQNGKPHKVTGVYPRGIQSCYRFVFDDKSYVDTDVDHLWTIRKTWGIKKFSWLTKSVKQIISEYGDFSKHSKNRIEIPMCESIQFPHQDVPLSPYIVGLLLGDGTLSDATPRFSTGDTDLLQAFTSNGFAIGQHPSKYDYAIKGISDIITQLGIRSKSSEKKIPEIYLYNSSDARLAILRGLMDTDGYIAKNGVCEFCSTSPFLADGVRFLINSLGGRVTPYKKSINHYEYKGEVRSGQTCYRLSFITDFNPFSLKRKADLWRPPIKSRNRRIKHIEYIGEMRTTCIKTDAEDGLYITKDCIVTHNTTLCMNFLGENIELNPVIMGNQYTQIVDEGYDIDPRFLNRLDMMSEWITWTNGDGKDKFTLLPVREDYAEHIVKNKINIVDWINIDTGEHYMIGTILEKMKRNVGRGVIIATIQKAEGATAGRGGQFTKDFADLELLVDKLNDREVLLTIGKCKEYNNNVIGKTYGYEIQKGVKIINFREVKKCSTCHGFGSIRGSQCSICDGNKYVNK